MTDPEFERRLRAIEDFRIQHEERCNGREERILSSIESLNSKVRAMNAKVDSQSKRLGKAENRIAYFQGYQAAAAAFGGILGAVIIEFVKKLL